jgi:hypothetical protein
MKFRTCLDYGSGRLNAGAMSRNSRQMAALRPASITVHDYGNVLRKLVGVKLGEQTFFLISGWFKGLGYFHSINPATSVPLLDSG